MDCCWSDRAISMLLIWGLFKDFSSKIKEPEKSISTNTVILNQYNTLEIGHALDFFLNGHMYRVRVQSPKQ